MDELAQEAADSHNPYICKHLLPSFYFNIGPQPGQQISYCEYKTAQLLKDASVCHLLMPSTYGIYCIAQIAGDSLGNDYCYLDDKSTLVCRIADKKEIFSYYKLLQTSHCEDYKKYNNEQVVSWCFADRALHYGELDTCLENASTTRRRDDCYDSRAQYTKDLNTAYCRKIEDTVRKTACIELVKSLIQYPELRK